MARQLSAEPMMLFSPVGEKKLLPVVNHFKKWRLTFRCVRGLRRCRNLEKDNIFRKYCVGGYSVRDVSKKG